MRVYFQLNQVIVKHDAQENANDQALSGTSANDTYLFISSHFFFFWNSNKSPEMILKKLHRILWWHSVSEYSKLLWVVTNFMGFIIEIHCNYVNCPNRVLYVVKLVISDLWWFVSSIEKQCLKLEGRKRGAWRGRGTIVSHIIQYEICFGQISIHRTYAFPIISDIFYLWLQVDSSVNRSIDRTSNPLRYSNFL